MNNTPRILIVAEHPNGFSGNSHMAAQLLRSIDYEKFNVSVFAGTTGVVHDPFEVKPPYQIIEGSTTNPDDFGNEGLLHTLEGIKVDVLLFVGIDIWRYGAVYNQLKELHKQKGFAWAHIFPYDLLSVRDDYLSYIRPVDFPCVYSKYGYEMLKDSVPHLQYFRPALYDSEKFQAMPEEARVKAKVEVFKSVKPDTFIYGFFGVNQFRKDPQRIIKAFFEVKKEFPNTALYLHTDVKHGVYNISQYLRDCGNQQGDVFIRAQDKYYNSEALVSTYNVVDCYVSASLQEGLNWTILEAMLCGVPVIASNSTAHIELLEGGAGIPVPVDGLAYLPMLTTSGVSWVEAKSVNYDALVEAMKVVYTSKVTRDSLIKKGKERAGEWLAGVSDVNNLLSEAAKKRATISFRKKDPAILFAQHGSAGDVLMSTACLKGIKEANPNRRLMYMTQIQFRNIVEGNPYVDEVLNWDEALFRDYEIVYNPHGEHILPGGFNNLDSKLYELYPYFCKVKPDKMFIKQTEPKIALPDDYYIVHTTGGDPVYRTYPHMDLVIKLLKPLGLKSLQIGGKSDMTCINVDLDLRGQLSFQETAFVMNHAKAAIVIDSFPSHLAGAVDTPAVVIFGPAPARVTQPRSDVAKISLVEPDKLKVCKDLTACWTGKVRGKSCERPCIKSINPMIIVTEFKKLLEK